MSGRGAKRGTRRPATGEPRAPRAAHAAAVGPRWAFLAILGLSLVVRCAYLIDSADNPTFRTPIVDAATYDELARGAALHGTGIVKGFFWQPFFYPYFLTIVYKLTGGSILAARLIQLVLGALTCALTYRFATRVFDRRVGILAGVMAAVCGPMIFFEAELVAAGWAAFWTIALLLLLERAARGGGPGTGLLLGLAGAAAIITRPTFAPFYVLAVLWLALRRWRARAARELMVPGVALVLGFVAIALPVSAARAKVTGRFGLLPSSGGINLYIGNHPDRARLVTLRPGSDGWNELADMPNAAGVGTDMWAHDAYFNEQVRAAIRAHPGTFLAGLMEKTLQYVSSREIPRNEDLYLFRQWSPVLGLLTWKVGGFGFPFGILLPLAVIGLVFVWRRVPVPVWLLVLIYPAAIILVFVSARYRVPTLPVVCVLAAAGVFAVRAAVLERAARRLAVMAALALATVALATVPGPFPEERQPLESEMYFGVAGQLVLEHKFDQAEPLLRRGLALDPDNANGHNNLGNLLLARQAFEEAAQHYARALELARDAPLIPPGFALGVIDQLAQTLYQLQRDAEVPAIYAAALERAPDNPRLHTGLGLALMRNERIAEGIAAYRQALQLDPTYVPALVNLAKALHYTGHPDEARATIEQALRLDPQNAEARALLARLRGGP